MPQVDFYHLTQSELAEALIMLLKKTHLAGKKALIQCPRPAAENIDDALWAHDAHAWLPHGLDDAKGAAFANSWIVSDGASNPIDAEFLFLLHGAERTDMSSFERVFNMFDGRSEAQIVQARTQWQTWRDTSKLDMRYFAQDESGKWEKRA